MFWAEDMSNLVQKVLDCESKVIYGNINDNWEIIIDHLIQGKNLVRVALNSCVVLCLKKTKTQSRKNCSKDNATVRVCQLFWTDIGKKLAKTTCKSRLSLACTA